jgi:exopolysaccharide biosynthesis polyprenyl glycosylphosphotransferase
VLSEVITASQKRKVTTFSGRSITSWQNKYMCSALFVDGLCGLAADALAAQVRFTYPGYRPTTYLAVTLTMPLLWLGAVALSGGYDSRFFGVGSDEFRKVLNAGVTLIATVAIICYTVKFDLARGYVAIALPTATILDLVARFRLRKRLHARRSTGACVQRVVAIGHADSVSALITELGRDSYHGLSVVAACLADDPHRHDLAGIPVHGGIEAAAQAVRHFDADSVAVLACPELTSVRLRELTWELESRGTEIYVAPALLDVAGPRTTIRPIAGLPLLHVDHPELCGGRQALKTLFDRASAAAAIVLLSLLFIAIAIVIKLGDGGPVFFKQLRVGQNGQGFLVWKFRTMVVDAEQRKHLLAAENEGNGVLFKVRKDPRVTKAGAWLRRYSLDELPQLFNVLLGHMSLVGPRPALPQETARYGRHMLRRLAVKPGITGLWQVSGRSDLSVDDSVRLDVRYVENWSLILDLQIIWKTVRAILSGAGAY